MYVYFVILVCKLVKQKTSHLLSPSTLLVLSWHFSCVIIAFQGWGRLEQLHWQHVGRQVSEWLSVPGPPCLLWQGGRSDPAGWWVQTLLVGVAGTSSGSAAAPPGLPLLCLPLLLLLLHCRHPLLLLQEKQRIYSCQHQMNTTHKTLAEKGEDTN